MIPEGWYYKKLDQLALVERGKFSARPRNDPKYYDGYIPFVQTGDVARSNGLLVNFSQTLNGIGLKVSKIFPKGTILITIAANIGEVAICKMDVAFPDSLVGIQAHSSISNVWLMHAIKMKRKFLEQRATQNAQKNINLEILRPLEIATPPGREQKAIASILSTWDRAIEKTEALIAAKERRKKWLMQQLLTGKKRLLSVNGEWEEKRIGVCLRGSNKRNTSLEFDSGDLMSVNKVDGMIPMKDRVKGESVNRCIIVEKDMFAYNPMRLNIGSICRWQGEQPCIVSPDYVVFKCADNLNPIYFDQLRQSSRWNDFMRKAGAGSVRVRIYLDDLNALKIPLPPLEEQLRIVEILVTADKEITIHRDELTALKEQKKGLMQQLLTGKVRVKVN